MTEMYFRGIMKRLKIRDELEVGRNEQHYDKGSGAGRRQGSAGDYTRLM